MNAIHLICHSIRSTPPLTWYNYGACLIKKVALSRNPLTTSV
jgi:hypothetical protein